jgi:hypothetical protein
MHHESCGVKPVFGLQELLDREIQKQFASPILGVRILESKLGSIGITLTNKQRKDLEKQFENLERGSLSFDFSEEQLQKAGVTSEEEIRSKVEEVVNGLGEAIERFADGLEDMMEGLVSDVVETMAKSVTRTLRKRMDDMLEDQAAIYHNVAEEVHSVWGKALDLLQGYIVITGEAAEGYLRKSLEANQSDITRDVLIRLHARACQISKEILALLRNGYADGAQARWRSLHELAVVANFIKSHGDATAERYIKHEGIESYKAAIQYNEFYTRLGAEPIPDKEISALKVEHEYLLAKYGSNYKYDYGWAADCLGIAKPTFRDIEEYTELDHLRPYYKAASANIHANPKGVLFRLGLFPEEDILLAGPSNIGLSDPAQSTVISLNQISTSLLTYDANIDYLVVCRVMLEYGKEVEAEFVEIEKQIHERRHT